MVNGEENAMKLTMQTMFGVEKTLCGCCGREVAEQLLQNEFFHKLFSELKVRNVMIRYVTEITADNIAYCKRLSDEFGFELRHLDGMRGNFAVGDLSRQYWGAAKVLAKEGSEPQLQIVWSNVSAMVEQNQYVFDLLWGRAVPAEARYKEIEHDIPRYETRVIRDSGQILAETKRMADTSKSYSVSSVSSVSGGLLYAYNHLFEDFKRILGNKEHGGMKWLTMIDESNIEAAKKFLELGMQIRHLDNVPTESFGLSEKEVGVTISRMHDGALNNSALFSNDPMYVEHYSDIFNKLWKSGMDAKLRIREIEEGVEEPRIRIIRDQNEVREFYLQLVNQAKEEILLLLPSSNALRRQTKIGVVNTLQAAASQRRVKVRMLAPSLYAKSSRDNDRLTNSRDNTAGVTLNDLIEYKPIREATGLNTVTILVVDRTRSLIIEQQDDAKPDFVEATGVATYSSRGSTVKANIRFFERMWEEAADREREELLLEKERKSRIEAELLQDILAHDIRNYNQAARLNAELLEEDVGSASAEDLRPLVRAVINAIDGSTRLVERASKIGKILAEGSNVRLFPVNLGETVENSLAVVRKSLRDKEIIVEKTGQGDGSVLADDMLQEAFVNLFSNSAKYTDEKNVKIEVRIDDAKDSPYTRIEVIDRGHGIPDELKSDLFTRYLKTASGSGLGLSIVHALVSDRYHGRVIVRDRVEGDHAKGAVIELFLPRAPSWKTEYSSVSS